jgi:hypothetical protein
LFAPGPDGVVPGVSASGEGGLLGLAISPTFATDGFIYSYATTDNANHVLRMRLVGNRLIEPKEILVGIPKAFNHNGGRLAFGPDGYLYVTTGDAGNRPAAQDWNSLAGKILRITASGQPAPGKGAATMVTDAIRTARAAGAVGEVLVRGDSAYGSRAVIHACLRAGARFSVVLTKNPAVARAIAGIGEDAWTPVRYPGAVEDPDTGELISDAEVAEVQFTAFASTKNPVTARLIMRRVRDRAKTEELFPVWRHHPFFTNGVESTPAADITHRRHAIIETLHTDLIDGPLSGMPSGRFAANGAWAICAAITHNLLRAAGTVIGGAHAVARGATLRRHLVAVPARLARPARRRVLHLPAHWPWAAQWNTLWNAATGPPAAA